MKDDHQLGLTRWNLSVQWTGQRGLKLAELDKVMDSKQRSTINGTLLTPHFIMVHCGSNDLTSEGVTGKTIMENIKDSILRYQALFKGAIIIWSSILPRRYWHFAPLGAGKYIEKKRTRVNAAVKNFVVANGGKFINNDQYISAKEVNLFHIDGTHLSPLGNDILLKNWKQALEMFINSDVCTYPQQ